MLRKLLYLQALAFQRAPYLGGRTVLAVLKGLGLVYAVFTAAAMGFLLPDTLSVWAPGTSVLTVVSQVVLPAMGLLTVGRVLFQDIPTRGAEAFLLLPPPRYRLARAITLRSLVSVFNVAPLAFAVPFAARSVRESVGSAEAVWFVAGMSALVAVSHFAVVVWKTRLGTAPGETVAVVGATLVGTAAIFVATGGVLGEHAAISAILTASIAAALGLFSHRSVFESLYLDPPVRAMRRAKPTSTGFEEPGLRAFVDLERRLILRTRFPRGIVLNAVAMTVAMALFAFVWSDKAPTVLLLIFSTGTIAVSGGQFAIPFASGHYDRFLTLPGAPRAFVEAKLTLAIAATVGLGLIQWCIALWLAPQAIIELGGAVLFCIGVLAPVAVLGSTLAPKPLDVEDKFMSSPRIQSLPPQFLLAAAGAIAVGLYAGLGPHLGLAAIAAVGALGALGMPFWCRLIEYRLERQRYTIAARFRSVL